MKNRHEETMIVLLSDNGDSQKQRFLYLFDYGDEWTFTVEVEQIEELDSVPFKPYVKESKGKSPNLYGYDEF